VVRVLIRVTKDLLNLALLEVEALLEVANARYTLIDYSGGDLILDVDKEESLEIMCRASSVRRIEFLDSGRIIKFDRSRYSALKRSAMPPHEVPIELRMARLLVNLARVKEGSVFLDPFIGAGGLALEAAMLGALVVGVEKDANTLGLAGTAIPYSMLINAYTPLVPIRDCSIDAIATDPPYGRSSLVDVDIEYIYEGLIAEAHRLLKPGSYIALSHPTYVDTVDILIREGFLVVGHGTQYVHGGLTRSVIVARKP